MKQNLTSAFTRQDVKILQRTRLYKGYLTLERLQLRYRLHQGDWSPPLWRELTVRRNAVAVLLYDPQLDAVVLIEQLRIGALEDPTSPWLVELIAGVIEPDETPATVVHREAQEEAGCTLSALTPIYNYWLSPGASTEKIMLFYGRVDAEKIGGVHGLASEHEDILVRVVKTNTALKALKAGQINNAITIIGLQWLALNKTKIRQDWL